MSVRRLPIRRRCGSQVGDVLTPGQRREFVIIRDNGQDREIRLSLKQIEVRGTTRQHISRGLPHLCRVLWALDFFHG